MEGCESLRFTSTSPSIASTQLQVLNESYTSMPFSFLNDMHKVHPPFTPSSPSPDMEAALELFSGRGDPSRSTPLEEADVLMADTYLEYVNEILMTEELEYSLPAEDGAQASYHALLSAFYDIIGEPLPLHSTSSQHASSAAGRSHSSENSETYFINSLDASCNGDMDAQKIKSLGELSSLHNDKDAPALHPGNFEHQDVSRELTAESSIDISFDELKVQADYAGLYMGRLSLSDTTSKEGKASSRNRAKKISSRAGRKDARCVQNGISAVVDFVDLGHLLVICAQAVAMGDVRRANQILLELYHVHGVSLQGNSLQRIAHYFCDALVARMAGTGGRQYRIMCENRPSVVSFLKASRVWYQMSPIMKMTHYFANKNILKAVEGAARLHVVDFAMEHGMQWPCLINALADRDAGPPSLVITGIEDPKADKNCLEKLKATGRRLAAYANRYRVPFQFHILVSEKWEDIDPAFLQLQEGEILVINCMKCLNRLADESVNPSSAVSPRQKLLTRIRNLNPHLLLMSEVNLAGSSPFFSSRFQEAVHYYHNKQDMLDTVCTDDFDRLLVEQSYSFSWILNIVACEGAERVERPETYKQWDSRIQKAGFELLVIPSDVLSRAKLYVKQHYHSNFMVSDDAKEWLLLGWKGRTLQAVSAWKPSCKVR